MEKFPIHFWLVYLCEYFYQKQLIVTHQIKHNMKLVNHFTVCI
jgi:hypothetical protein